MSKGASIAVQAILLLAIAGLGYFLYRSINDPYEERLRIVEAREDVRQRMSDIRQVLIRHNQVHERFPSTLDSVKIFAESDSSLQADVDELFGPGYRFDSLLVSPLSGERFQYTASDTGRVKYYRLISPDYPEDVIGADRPDVTKLNVATWE
jgi:hypothetical protein